MESVLSASKASLISALDFSGAILWMCSALNSYKQDFPKAGYLKGIQFECDGMHVMQEKRISCSDIDVRKCKLR